MAQVISMDILGCRGIFMLEKVIVERSTSIPTQTLAFHESLNASDTREMDRMMKVMHQISEQQQIVALCDSRITTKHWAPRHYFFSFPDNAEVSNRFLVCTHCISYHECQIIAILKNGKMKSE